MTLSAEETVLYKSRHKLGYGCPRVVTWRERETVNVHLGRISLNLDGDNLSIVNDDSSALGSVVSEEGSSIKQKSEGGRESSSVIGASVTRCISMAVQQKSTQKAHRYLTVVPAALTGIFSASLAPQALATNYP